MCGEVRGVWQCVVSQHSPRRVQNGVDSLQQRLDGQLTPVEDQTVVVLGHTVSVSWLIKGEGHPQDGYAVVLSLLQPQVTAVGDKEPRPIVSWSIR